MVAGIDGLFDNIFESEMEVVIKPVVEEEDCLEPKVLTLVLAKTVLKNSLETEGVSPFSQGAVMKGYHKVVKIG